MDHPRHPRLFVFRVLKHLVASQHQLFAFAAYSEIHSEKHALPEFDASADAPGWMQILQAQIFRTSEDPAGIHETNDVKKSVQGPPVLHVQDESIAVAETVLIETADGIHSSGDRQ